MENFKIFDSELEKLTHRIIQMCMQVSDQLKNVVIALETLDLSIAKKIIENDNAINDLDVKIDKMCQRIFALQQPVASDLRYIISALKINNDLERIGDHAVNIAKKIDSLQPYPQLTESSGICLIGEQSKILFSDLVELIKTHDLTYAVKVANKAERLKEQCEDLSTKILEEMPLQSEGVIATANILIINNLFERITSYSTNIAESVSFVVTGEIIKHKISK